MKIKSKFIITVTIAVFCVLGLSTGQTQAQDIFGKGSTAILTTNNVWTGDNEFQNITVRDTFFSSSVTNSADSSWRITNRYTAFYGYFPAIEKDTANVKLNIRNHSRDLGASAFLTFNTFATGFNDPTENSYVGQGGRSFFLMNMSYNGVFIGGNGHDNYKLIMDSSSQMYWSALNSPTVGGSITQFRDPLGTETNRRFLKTWNDSLNGVRAWNTYNQFSNNIGTKISGTKDITSFHYVVESDSSRNYDGTNTRGINWRRDGKMLYAVDNDTNQIKLYDFSSPNPIRFLTLGVDSVDADLTCLKVQNTLTGEVASCLFNTTTGFTATDGFRIRMTGVNATVTNMENGNLGLGVNGSSVFVINSTGTTTSINNHTITWAAGVTASIERGTTDPDQTTLALRTPNGTLRYIVIADDGTISSTTTHP